jgi:hypothetical protein
MEISAELERHRASVSSSVDASYSDGKRPMTIILTLEQEQAVRDAIRAGRVASVEALIEGALAALPKGGEGHCLSERSVFEQGLGLFGSLEDSALLDEVVALVYDERRRRK